MATHTYAPYRDCCIKVCVTPSIAHAFGGTSRRFRVSWTVASPRHADCDLVSFPEQLEFLSEAHALKYGEDRAHTFIDSVLAVSLTSRALGGASVPVREAPAV